MIDFAIIGNYRNSIWEGLPHIFYEALHSKWILSLSHSLRPLFPTCTLAPSLFQTAPSITEQQGTMPRHFRATCSRGRFRSAPGHSELFLILDGFWAFVGHNLMIRITILVSLANLISMHHTWSEALQHDELWRSWFNLFSFLHGSYI